MAQLVPVPFRDLLTRMVREFETADSIFDLPRRKWHVPDPSLDLSAVHHDHRPAIPLGPAAGPHTQLAQNIVLSWLAGSRIIELKTVQINDRLEIPRPCIHAPNVGYNVEWSQELRIEESIQEYVKAAYLIGILKHTRVFGAFPDGASLDTVFDLSVGYDLKGIRSPAVGRFLAAMGDASADIDALRGEIPAPLAAHRDVPLDPCISSCVTLSTFHGCPADEIESICRFLIEDAGVHTLVKLNPTLLGFEAVRELLHDRLGYRHLVLRREAFDNDLRYDAGQAMLARLKGTAEDRGTTIGAKFTNTLVVENDPVVFPTQADPYMYLSGPPLHVISMTLMQRFREEAGFEFPVSFSAGVDAVNFPAAAACGLVPVTTCTDLLKQGGYGRLPAYVKALARRMGEAGTTSRDAFVLAAHGHGAEAVREALEATPGGAAVWQAGEDSLTRTANESADALPDALRAACARAGLEPEPVLLRAVRISGRLNGRDVVPKLADDPRYRAEANAKPPRRIGSTLALYDCINCDICIPVCPNDAMFAYELPPERAPVTRWEGTPSGATSAPHGEYAREKDHQLAVFADACNECSNCEVFCPEDGAPFLVKERFFLTEASFEASPGHDGFVRSGHGLRARLDGRELSVTVGGDTVRLAGDGLTVEATWPGLDVREVKLAPGEVWDSGALHRIRAAWTVARTAPRPNMVHPEPAAD